MQLERPEGATLQEIMGRKKSWFHHLTGRAGHVR